MKLTRNFLLFFSLFISLIGLILIYIASINLEPRKIAINEITADMEGRKIATTGYIVNKREHKDGHLFLTISDNEAKIQVPLFANFMNSLAQVGITKDDFKLNSKIAVEGLLENYRGQLQIVPKKLSDIKILGE